MPNVVFEEFPEHIFGIVTRTLDILIKKSETKYLEEADFLGVFPLTGQGRVRLIGTVRDERADLLSTHERRVGSALSRRGLGARARFGRGRRLA